MTNMHFTSAVQVQDALDVKAFEIEQELQAAGWYACSEVFRNLANEKTNLSEEYGKLLLIDYLDIYLELKTRYPDKGDNYLVAKVQEEISEARTDKLTGIGNRRAFDEAFNLEQSIISRMNNEEGRNKKYTSSIISFDANGLKAVNDSLGHEAGDKFISHFAKVISEHSRGSDKLYRVGGDEFIMIVSGKDASDCDSIVQNIRTALDKNSFIYDRMNVTMKTGAGICELDAESDKSEILKQADDNLYADKEGQPKSVMQKVFGSPPAGSSILRAPTAL